MSGTINSAVIRHCNLSLEKDVLRQGPFFDFQAEGGSFKLAGFVKWLEIIGYENGSGTCWNLGQDYDFNLRGEIGKSILSAHTLGGALKKLVEYFPLIQDDSLLKLETNGRWSTLTYKILDPEIWPRHHDALYSLGIYATLIKLAAPSAWFDIEIMFEAPSNMFSKDILKTINAKCSFEADANVLIFPTRILDNILPKTQDITSATSKSLSRQLILKKRQTEMHIRVRNMIMKLVEYGTVQQEEVARELGMSSRTLRRKLTAEGYSFQQILDDCRMKLVTLEFKTKGQVSLSQMALKLGYSEHSTFSRAFARWAGLAPQEYRNQFLSAVS